MVIGGRPSLDSATVRKRQSTTTPRRSCWRGVGVPVTAMMGMRATSTNETSLVVAAQAGDRRALDELAAAYLPFVYAIVRRALSGHADVDDVVQETMVRALRELRALRGPENFRPWLAAIAMRQVGTYLHRRRVAEGRVVAADEVAEAAGADIEGLTLLRLELSGQRREVVRASRWLDPDDRALLSLWWLETAGRMTRTELAGALGMSVAHAGVRVQRMRQQLELSRSVVAALEATPRCARLSALAAGWDGVPGPLWRKRLGRHVRSCEVCGGAGRGRIPLERLLVGFALLPVPAALWAAILGKGALTATSLGAASAVSGAAVSGATVSGATGAGGAGVKAGLFGQLVQALLAHPVAATVATGTLVAGATVTTVTRSEPEPRPPAVIVAPTSAPAVVAPPPSPAVVPPPPRRPRPAATEPSANARPVESGPASLESVNQPGSIVTTVDGLGVLARIGAGGDPAARRRATFEVVPGLADPKCVTLRAEDGRYLRHIFWRVRLSPDEGTALFRGDATFCVRPGPVPGSLSLESSNYPGWYLRHRGAELWVDQSDGSAAFRADAAFRARAPLAG
jgi:RNA polymerase sigma factor (sigma-70 family)